MKEADFENEKPQIFLLFHVANAGRDFDNRRWSACCLRVLRQQEAEKKKMFRTANETFSIVLGTSIREAVSDFPNQSKVS